MAAPSVSPAPSPPLPSDDKSVFDSKAYAFVNWQADFATQVNALVAWMNSNVGAQNIVTVTGSSYELLAENSGSYHVFTSDSEKTVTVRAESEHPLPAGYTITGENEGDEDLILDDTDVTIRSPLGGTLVVPSGGAFTLIRTSADEFKLIGDTVPA